MQSENDINYKDIGENIKRQRIKKGIAQVELARAIDVSQTHMSNIENGNTGISLWTAIKISRVLGCSIDSFADKERCSSKDKADDDGKIDVEDLIEALRLVSWKNKSER